MKKPALSLISPVHASAFTGHYQGVSGNWETEVYKDTLLGISPHHLCIKNIRISNFENLKI
jgi:hypothetical protein